ncbi:MAG: ROK family protein [Planctomycetota bacterium]
MAKKLSFSPATTSLLVGELISQGYVREAGQAQSTGGRPGILLELAGEGRIALGLDFEETRLTCTAVDFRGERIASRGALVSAPAQPGQILDAFEELARRTLEDAGGGRLRLLGVGVALPGLVSHRRGLAISHAPFPEWRDVPVREVLESRLGVPAYVEKNKHTAALAERWFGCARDVRNFVCLSIRSGLGIGAFIDGHLLKGEDENAGEIGHIALDAEGPRCSCGATGCLCTVLSGRAIVERAREELEGFVPGADLPSTLGELVRLAGGGSEEARELFREAGTYLGIAVANVINIFNPALVVVSGDLLGARDMMQASMEEAIARRALSYCRRCARVEWSTLDREAPALGAATLVLQDMVRHLERERG